MGSYKALSSRAATRFGSANLPRPLDETKAASYLGRALATFFVILYSMKMASVVTPDLWERGLSLSSRSANSLNFRKMLLRT